MNKLERKQGSKKMLSFAPAPILSNAWDHRPSIPSPLASSPVRATEPLSPISENTLSFRAIQSSPISAPKFKYASRPTRPNPVVRRREEAQEQRRRSFLREVRKKSDDNAWKRRDIEGQFLKNSALASIGQLSYDAPTLSEADIEDAIAFEGNEDEPQLPTLQEETMVGEDRELEAMIASYEQQQQQQPPSHEWNHQPEPHLSDEEYDEIFDELMAQEQWQSQQLISTQLDADDDVGMTL